MTVTTSNTRQVARRPEQIHELFTAFANAGDVHGLLSLYEPDALAVPKPGAQARGTQQLRVAFTELCSLQARFTAHTDAVHVVGDLALMTNTWTATSPTGGSFGGRTTEVVRRQPDGRWLDVIDDPNWIE